ncbi:histidine utilization repressor [Indioceanicola profundi]|uniref:histidine utilization repressor n=1 Tax=Indioceanicola profundi TaxID=2220096 RepID=UPI001CECBD18|nr:histidine utilization repressor [Indioceanicola profundi]
MVSRADDAPLYQRVKAHVLDRIAVGELKPGDRVPSEHELVAALGVSRMTANRALRELTAEGRLTRTAGVGTFVAAAKPVGTVLEIRNIADEIRERGGTHSADVLHLAEEEAPAAVAAAFDLAPGTPLYHSILLHRENGRPLQIEDRWVLPAAAPGYLALDFTRITPSRHLLDEAPVVEVEHLVEAILPDARTARLLEMEAGEPCLRLSRRTWTDGPAGRVASLADFLYPGSRYRLGGRFRPV